MIQYSTTLKNNYYFFTNNVIYNDSDYEHINDGILINIDSNQDKDNCGLHLVTYLPKLDNTGHVETQEVRNGAVYLDQHHTQIVNKTGDTITVPVYSDNLDHEECKKIFPNFIIGYYDDSTETPTFEYVTYYLQNMIEIGDRFIDGTFVRNNIHNNIDNLNPEDSSEGEEIEPDIEESYDYYVWMEDLNTYTQIEEIHNVNEVPNTFTYDWIRLTTTDEIYYYTNDHYELINFVEKEDIPSSNDGEYIKVLALPSIIIDVDDEDEETQNDEKDTPYLTEFNNSIKEDLIKLAEKGYTIEQIKAQMPHWLFPSNYDNEYMVNGKKMKLFSVTANIEQLDEETLLNNIYDTINEQVVKFANEKLSKFNKEMMKNYGNKVIMVSEDNVCTLTHTEDNEI